MRFKLFSSCAVFALATLSLTTARAADFGEASSPTSSVTGYVEGYGGTERGWSTHYDPNAGATDRWSDDLLGGSGRVGWAIDPSWSLQGDFWTVAPVGSPGTFWGVSGHVTWHSTSGAEMLGVLASLGTGGFDAGNNDNLAVEGVVNAGRWRLYGQAGVTSGQSGDAAGNGERDRYATVSANYFFNSNLYVSANIGADKWTQSNGDSSPELSWGAKIEFKPDLSPMSFFVAYEGYGFRSNYGGEADYDKGVDNIFFVGARIPLGVGTLRDMQHAVGLADLNPLFGDIINR